MPLVLPLKSHHSYIFIENTESPPSFGLSVFYDIISLSKLFF